MKRHLTIHVADANAYTLSVIMAALEDHKGYSSLEIVQEAEERKSQEGSTALFAAVKEEFPG